MALQTKTYSVDKNTFTLRLTLTENSTSISGNTSSVSYKLELISTTKDFYNFGVGAKIEIDGRVVASRNRGDASSRVNLPVRSSVTLLSGSTSIGHENGGEKTIDFDYSIDMALVSYTPGPMSGSDSMELTTIPRGATITSAPNFTDEDNPKITISNPAGVTVEAGIYMPNGLTELAAYREATVPSYTFQLTDTDRNAIRKANTTANSFQVRFYVRSTVGGQTFRNYVAKTVTIKNPAPTLSPSIVDVNASTVALTGDNNVMVRYVSNAQITTGAQAVKFATLKSVKVMCGGKSLSGDGTISGVEFGSFQISATDSRGNTTTQTVKKTLIEYITPTCYIDEGVPNALGEYDFSTSGSAWNGDFGDTINTLTAEYRYRLRGAEDWGEWLPMTVQTNGNNYTATAHVTGLDYTATYEFQGRVSDKLNTAESSVKVVSSIPTFDWGPNDFNFNVPVFMTEHLEDGSSVVHSLLGAGCTAHMGKNLGTVSDNVIAPMTVMDSQTGGFKLSGNGIEVPSDGFYVVAGQIMVSDGAKGFYLGLQIDGTNHGYILDSYTSFPIGYGVITSVPTVVYLKSGEVVTMTARMSAASSGALINANARTKITILKVF